jgi:hypothetical protein
MTLMAAGVACFIFYGLLSLSGSANAQTRIASIPLFVGIVAFLAGLVRYMTAGESDR